MVIQKERGGGSISLGGPKALDIRGPRSPISLGIWAPYRGGGGGGGGEGDIALTPVPKN